MYAHCQVANGRTCLQTYNPQSETYKQCSKSSPILLCTCCHCLISNRIYTMDDGVSQVGSSSATLYKHDLRDWVYLGLPHQQRSRFPVVIPILRTGFPRQVSTSITIPKIETTCPLAIYCSYILPLAIRRQFSP